MTDASNAQPIQPVVRTSRLEVVSPDERHQIVAASTNSGSSFEVRQGSSPRIKIAIDEDGVAGVLLYDEDFDLKAEIRVRRNGMPEVVLYDDHGQRRARLFVNGDNEPKLTLMDDAGDVMIKLAIQEDGEVPSFELRDYSGETRIGGVVTDTGVPILGAFDGYVIATDDDGDVVGQIPQGKSAMDYMSDANSVLGLIRLITG